MGWVIASLEANKDPERRYSARGTGSLEDSKKKYERIMMVVKLG